MFGAIIGDVIGSAYEGSNNQNENFIINDNINHYTYTDDTIMTLAVAEILENNKWNDRNYIIDTFKRWGNNYPWCGFGPKFFDWVLSDDKEPYNSCGNGAAMRISPCGWYGNSVDEVTKMATAVTEVTHNHPEGIKGAVVTALSIYYARIGKTKEFIKKYIENNYDINFDYNELKKTYYKEDIICQITVPVALYCFLISNSFEDCLRKTIALGGDTDTTAAISCAVAEAYYKKIPQNLLFDSIAKLEYKNNCDIETLIDKHLIQMKENNIKLIKD